MSERQNAKHNNFGTGQVQFGTVNFALRDSTGTVREKASCEPCVRVCLCQASPREGEHLLGVLLEQGVLGGVGEHQHHIDVAGPQLHQVTTVGDVSQLRHLHKVLLWGTTGKTGRKRKREKEGREESYQEETQQHAEGNCPA